MEHVGRGIGLSLLISMPAILLAASIGLIVGILQAVTQVQEQTISAAPKIISVFALVVLGGGVIMNLMTGYMRESANIAFNLIPRQEDMVLPPRKTRVERGIQNPSRQFDENLLKREP